MRGPQNILIRSTIKQPLFSRPEWSSPFFIFFKIFIFFYYNFSNVGSYRIALSRSKAAEFTTKRWNKREGKWFFLLFCSFRFFLFFLLFSFLYSFIFSFFFFHFFLLPSSFSCFFYCRLSLFSCFFFLDSFSVLKKYPIKYKSTIYNFTYL